MGTYLNWVPLEPLRGRVGVFLIRDANGTVGGFVRLTPDGSGKFVVDMNKWVAPAIEMADVTHVN